ncbi:uncharacterized protein CYBJADRAFT_168913, partial [Cyberlindnera jadinii NRRL Y-1542]
ATPVRAFSKSAVRMNAAGNTPASKWFGAFGGVAVLLGIFAFGFDKLGLQDNIKHSFNKTGINTKKDE